MAPSLPKRPNVCTHIKAAGQRCGSPALRGEFFCYFHTRIIKGVQQRVDMRLDSMALLEDCESIQLSLMYVVDGLVKGTLDPNRAKLIIQALRIAARNAKNVRFDDQLYKPTDPPMVREIPDYARQYQIEHPADPRSADAPVREEDAKQPSPRSAEATTCNADTLVRKAKPTTGPCGAHIPVRQAKPMPAAQRVTQASPEAAQQNVSMKSAKSTTAEPAAKRRQNTAHGASRGSSPENNPAPEERKNHRDDHRNPLPAHESRERELIQQAEAAIAGAQRGNWDDLRTVLEFAGITEPSKEAPY